MLTGERAERNDYLVAVTWNRLDIAQPILCLSLARDGNR